MTRSVGSVVAGCFAMAGFAVAVIAGLTSGNPTTSILIRALIAMVACYPVGLLIGVICQQVVKDHLDEPARANLVPDQAAEGVLPGIEQTAQSAEEGEDVTVV